jgi:hypothetical protein
MSSEAVLKTENGNFIFKHSVECGLDLYWKHIDGPHVLLVQYE